MDKRDLKLVQDLFNKLDQKIADLRARFERPLTLAEKILYSHLYAWPTVDVCEKGLPIRGKTSLELTPDRIALQDATAQMALLQYMVTERPTVAVPTTIHCDHLIQAQVNSETDLAKAMQENKEVYDFLLTAAQKYGIGFWKPGSGIIHQVVLEQYAFPGGLMIGTDSHTPNAGGLGMLAIGVGGADAVDVMAAQPWRLMTPKLVGVHLKGKLNGWTSAKDVILKVAGLLTVKGGTGKIVEYFGEGASSISCTGKATITNMGAELGATTSVFAYDQNMAKYLRSTERSEVADIADKICSHLNADPEVLANPNNFYDEVLEIDLSTLEPQWVGPHTPDLLRKVSEMPQAIKDNTYAAEPRYALIGSCTNSSYEDIARAASVAKQALSKGLKCKVPLMVTPGSDQVFKTIERDGFLDILLQAGATVLANACGPCIGQWKRSDIKAGEKNTIVTSYNRNFAKRNDGNAETCAFISSPEMVTAVAFAGNLGFDPRVDLLKTPSGKDFKFNDPVGDQLPVNGFVFSKAGFEAPIDNESERKKIPVVIAADSGRLAFLESFQPFPGSDFKDLLVLMKAKGKCTTDHISQAGPWLKYRGHLAKISDNMFIGAINAFTQEVGKGKNVLSGESGLSYPELAKQYKAAGQGWVVIGDENYGEGSSREHAAMSPRFLGCLAVIVKSFARIHETNLKKQGIVPLTFVNPGDYDLIEEDDRVSILGLADISPNSKVSMKLKGSKGEREIALKHNMLEGEISWFNAGSALNTLKPQS
jgi:aconitate hydratase